MFYYQSCFICCIIKFLTLIYIFLEILFHWVLSLSCNNFSWTQCQLSFCLIISELNSVLFEGISLKSVLLQVMALNMFSCIFIIFFYHISGSFSSKISNFYEWILNFWKMNNFLKLKMNNLKIIFEIYFKLDNYLNTSLNKRQVFLCLNHETV